MKCREADWQKGSPVIGRGDAMGLSCDKLRHTLVSRRTTFQTGSSTLDLFSLPACRSWIVRSNRDVTFNNIFARFPHLVASSPNNVQSMINLKSQLSFVSTSTPNTVDALFQPVNQSFSTIDITCKRIVSSGSKTKAWLFSSLFR